ncbi:tetratricopeptide repeat protein [Bacteroidota bacterium]
MSDTIRQLAAIMFTDIEGYTALMQENEDKAVKVRDRHREIFNSATKKFNGKILQYYGDGTLSIFNSAIDAVMCGIEMQLEFQKWPQIPVRIGIHLGDIIMSEEEIVGDGVNVASRIESLAVAGSLLISDKVNDEIKNHKDIQTNSLGSFELKNVEKPINVYCISNEGLVIPKTEDIKGKTKAQIPAEIRSRELQKKQIWRKRITRYAGLAVILCILLIWSRNFITVSNPEIDSIAVLPLDNMTGDKDQEYLSDGMTEALLTELSKISALRVISRTSVMKYKGTEKSIPEIAKELNVKSIVEGSVMRDGNKIRIVAQLIATTPERHLWAKSFDRDMEDIFALYSDVAQAITKEIQIAVTPEEIRRIKTTRKTNPEAVEAYLRGQYHANRKSEYDLLKAVEYFKVAIDKDSSYSQAYAMMAYSYVELGNFSILSSRESYPYAIKAAEKALELDNNIAEAHASLGMAEMTFNWNWPKAEKELLKAIEINPNSGLSLEWYAEYLLAMGKSDQAIEMIKRSMNLYPLAMPPRFHLGDVYQRIGKYDLAIEQAQILLELNPEWDLTYVLRGNAYSGKGMYKEAEADFIKAIELRGGENGYAYSMLGWMYARSGETGKARKILEELKVNTSEYPIFQIIIALICEELGDRKQAIDWLQEAYDDRNMLLSRLGSFHDFEYLKSDAEVQELLKKIGLME